MIVDDAMVRSAIFEKWWVSTEAPLHYIDADDREACPECKECQRFAYEAGRDEGLSLAAELAMTHSDHYGCEDLAEKILEEKIRP